MKINNQIKKYIYISLGAVPGVIFRWQIDQIFIVNMIGCFFIGLFNSLSFDSKYKLTLCVGFCGSLTTFSGWIFGLSKLISDGLYISAFASTLLMLMTGFLAVCLGNLLAKKIQKLF